MIPTILYYILVNYYILITVYYMAIILVVVHVT